MVVKMCSSVGILLCFLSQGSSALAQTSPKTLIEGAAKRPAGIYPCLQDDVSLEGGNTFFVECVNASRPLVDLIRARNAAIALNPTEIGCVGRDVITCMATLGGRTRVTSSIAGSMAGELIYKDLKPDIYGKKQSQIYSFQIAPFGVSSPTYIATTIYSANGRDFTNIDFMLPRSPLSAHSETDWDQTAVFELARDVLGDCVGSDKLAFYRTYDAAQRNGRASKGIDQDYADPGVSSGIHGAFEVCGTKISIVSVSGVSVNLGAWHGSTMTIAAPTAAKTGTTHNGFTPSPAPAGQNASQIMQTATTVAATMAAKGGFGIYFSVIPQGLILIAVAPGSRAEQGRLKAGQLVTAINGKSIAGMSQADVLGVIKGSTGVTTFAVAGLGDLQVAP